MEEPITVFRALQEASGELKRAGLPDSRHEAELLLAFILGLPRYQIYTGLDHSLSLEQIYCYRKAILLRVNRCPVAYIKGVKEFYGFEFQVDRNVLIPRPETETLIDTVVEWCRGQEKYRGKGLNIVDLGTGSGAIVVTLALLLPRACFWAVDISPGALGVAQKNACRHGVRDRIEFRLGNYWEVFYKEDGDFQVVVSNPPYIPRRRISSLPRDVKDYEPALALDGGEDGMESYRRILDGLDGHTASPALIALELDREVSSGVFEICRLKSIFTCMEIIKDLSGQDRVLKALI